MSSKSCCSIPPPKPDRPGLTAYAPLFVILLFTALAAAAKQVSYPAISWHLWMLDFMGFFLLVFAMVKLFDLPSFATGFAKYDLLAARSRTYALIYPFLELTLGLAYLARWQPTTTYLATIILLTFGALGVLNTMRQGKQLTCACMGQLLKVPVSTVTLTENLSMAAMALIMLIR
ncbi:MAG: hypothetical protein ACJAVK_000256 [Akkermansiaceae bacterium]|jgi:hypothetical protein